LAVLSQRSPRTARYAIRAAIVAGVAWLAACPRSITDNGFRLSVAPPAANLFVDDNLQLTATLADGDGTPVSTTYSWSSDDPSVASVDANGLVHGMGAGSVTIRVSARGEEASAMLTVVVDSGQTLSVAPAAVSLFVDNSQRLSATLKDRHGDVVPATPNWSSDNSGVATVDQTGLVHATGTGSATIEAKVHNLRATATVTVDPRPSSVVLVGAGDIATSGSGDAQTANLLDGIQGTVFALGDNAYPNGATSDYSTYYAPTWGRHKARTRPVPGNHEYLSSGAAPYFDYFGAAAGESPKGYYSYDLGGWHMIALNSNLASDAGSPQEQWLRADLATSQARCTLAYWHHPRFSSGTTHGDAIVMIDLWQALYDYGAEMVLSAHEHNYERFAPQTPTGASDPSKGIREFVVGTGGGTAYAFGAPKPNSEVRYNATPGVLKLTLYPDRYEWQFIPTSGSFRDSGSGSCH
jgi:hypothetical protein